MLTAVFFCGDRSRYGLAHLAPVLAAFQVRAVVVATPARWTAFRRMLAGHSHAVPAAGEQWAARVRGVMPALRSRYFDARLAARIRRGGADIVRQDDVNAPDFLARLRAIDADVFLSAAYPQLFRQPLLDIPRAGAVNFHPSLLPSFRGAHPHFWAIATGAAEGGVSAHYMTERIDEGDVIARRAWRIADAYYGDYYAEIERATPALVGEVAEFLVDGGRIAEPQDPARATWFRNDRDIHRRIAWTLMTAREVWNLVRTEVAFCEWRGARLWLRRARLVPTNRNLTNGVRVEPGTVVDIGVDAVVVAARDGCLEVERVFDGRRTLATPEWATRERVRIGERLV